MRYQKFRELEKLNQAEVVPALLKASELCSSTDGDIYKEAVKIEQCGGFIRTIKCSHCGTNHFKSFDRCKSKFCYLCNRVKSSLWVAMLYSWLKGWLSQGHYVVFLTLTLKDTDKLEDGLKQLEGAWRLMTGQRYRKAFLAKFPGGFRSIEVKTGENSGQWHPHIHSIVLKDKFSGDTNFLHYVWPRCVAEMGGYARDLHIEGVKRKVGEDEEAFHLRLIKAIKDSAKYFTKFNWANEPPERVVELYNALKGKRQYAVWGKLSYLRQAVNAKLKSTNTDDAVKDFVCQVCGCTEGTPNKLFKAIWDSVDEPIIKDYSTVAPSKTMDLTAKPSTISVESEPTQQDFFDDID